MSLWGKTAVSCAKRFSLLGIRTIGSELVNGKRGVARTGVRPQRQAEERARAGVDYSEDISISFVDINDIRDAATYFWNILNSQSDPDD